MHGDKVAQTGKASAKPEYSFSIAFVDVLVCFLFLFFFSHKKKIFPCTCFLCSLQLLLQNREGGWGSLLCGEKTFVLSPGASSSDTCTLQGTSARHPGIKPVALIWMYCVPEWYLLPTGEEIPSQTF